MAKGYFNYSEQKLILNNDYLKTVLQELDYEDLHGENAECNMLNIDHTDTFHDKEVKIYMFNLSAMRFFYIEGEKYYSLYNFDGFYYICTDDYAKEVLQDATLKDKELLTIKFSANRYSIEFGWVLPYKKPFNKMTNTEQATYMINSLAGIKKVMSDEGIDIDDSTQFSEYPVLLKQDADNVLVKSKNGVSGMEATSENGADINLENYLLTLYWEVSEDLMTSNLVVQCYDKNGNEIPVDLIVKKRAEETSPDKGSFDKDSQTLTLNNSYVVDLINQMSDNYLPIKQIMLEAIGSNDLIYDFSQATTYPTTEMLYCPANIQYEGNPLGFVMSMSGGSYTIVAAEGVSPVNTEGLNSMLGDRTIQDLINMGCVADENVFTITGTQGNYDVTFN